MALLKIPDVYRQNGGAVRPRTAPKSVEVANGDFGTAPVGPVTGSQRSPHKSSISIQWTAVPMTNCFLPEHFGAKSQIMTPVLPKERCEVAQVLKRHPGRALHNMSATACRPGRATSSSSVIYWTAITAARTRLLISSAALSSDPNDKPAIGISNDRRGVHAHSEAINDAKGLEPV
ncbi:hypothetical protein CONLIGDRAFT_328133 [Coniochaeta ligniaria NRRL 30616]|uniref:Uncharacterized protein n=1 Tax=Coniochaeta ligniaria NRRL 30616 TaxID=1408157 RepID=A0A1J7JI75_9PEZI|nr:hypothetical protein CONLIGDRAFT_328133 [Coniochaeta ligniaria NRRL 30616]